jgi:transcription initiation factor TFIIIB Brf1 subunit/transcription initiation factor TFIIB
MPKKVCPACGSNKIEYNEQGKYYKCGNCGFVIDEWVFCPHPTDWRAELIPEDRSVYNEEEQPDEEIEDDGIIGDELFG